MKTKWRIRPESVLDKGLFPWQRDYTREIRAIQSGDMLADEILSDVRSEVFFSASGVFKMSIYS
jgi:hypothetical protein